MREPISLRLEGNEQATLSVSATPAHTGELPEGIYAVWATGDVYIKVGTTANDVASSTGYLVRSGETVRVWVGAKRRIGAVAGSAATLSYHKVL